MIFALLLGLLALSALFSSSETALFSIDRAERSRLRSENSASARLILSLLGQPRELLIAILFGNTLINVSYFSVAAALASELGRTEKGSFLEPATHLGSLFGVIILGEILPKSFTVLAPTSIARIVAPVLRVWMALSRFVTTPLGRVIGSSLERLERRWPAPGPLSNVELAQLVTLQGGEDGELTDSVSDLLEDVLLLSQIRVREIMTPRVDVRSFDMNEGREAFLELVGRCRLSKIPVHSGGGLDALSGVLSFKEVLRSPKQALASLVEPAWFIPDSMRVDRLLQEMLSRSARLAIVVDEYGGTSGIVTVEDVIEEVVGDISVQRRGPKIRQLPEGGYVVPGALSIREVNDILSLRLPDEGSTTIAGFVARQLGRMPLEGDVIERPEALFKVARVEKLRVRLVAIRLPEPKAAEAPQ